MILGQVFSILALLASWLWWPTFAISVVAMVMHQIVWCVRHNKAGMVSICAISVVAGLLSISCGIWELVVLRRASWCGLFYFSDADMYDTLEEMDGVYDECKERVFAALSFVTAALWLASSGCTIYFVKSGRYDHWEAKWSHTATTNNNEDNTEEEQTNNEGDVAMVVTKGVAAVEDVEGGIVAEASIVEAYVPPDVAGKVDEAA